VYISAYVQGFPSVSAHFAITTFRITDFNNTTSSLKMATIRFTKKLENPSALNFV
jgi:hypothetical protein